MVAHGLHQLRRLQSVYLLILALYAKAAVGFTVSTPPQGATKACRFTSDGRQRFPTMCRMNGLDGEPPKALEDVDFQKLDLTPPPPTEMPSSKRGGDLTIW